MADGAEVAEAGMIGQLLDVARPVDETPTRLEGRTAEPGPVRADESNAGLNRGGIQEAADESGVVAAVEENDGQPRFGAVLPSTVFGHRRTASRTVLECSRRPNSG